MQQVKKWKKTGVDRWPLIVDRWPFTVVEALPLS